MFIRTIIEVIVRLNVIIVLLISSIEHIINLIIRR